MRKIKNLYKNIRYKKIEFEIQNSKKRYIGFLIKDKHFVGGYYVEVELANNLLNNLSISQIHSVEPDIINNELLYKLDNIQLRYKKLKHLQL